MFLVRLIEECDDLGFGLAQTAEDLIQSLRLEERGTP